MSIDMRSLLDTVIEKEATDLHLEVGKPPMVRVKGILTRSGTGPWMAAMALLLLGVLFTGCSTTIDPRYQPLSGRVKGEPTLDAPSARIEIAEAIDPLCQVPLLRVLAERRNGASSTVWYDSEADDPSGRVTDADLSPFLRDGQWTELLNDLRVRALMKHARETLEVLPPSREETASYIIWRPGVQAVKEGLCHLIAVLEQHDYRDWLTPTELAMLGNRQSKNGTMLATSEGQAFVSEDGPLSLAQSAVQTFRGHMEQAMQWAGIRHVPESGTVLRITILRFDVVHANTQLVADYNPYHVIVGGQVVLHATVERDGRLLSDIGVIQRGRKDLGVVGRWGETEEFVAGLLSRAADQLVRHSVLR